MLNKTRSLLKNETITEADYNQVANQLEAAEVGMTDAEEAYRDAKRNTGRPAQYPHRPGGAHGGARDDPRPPAPIVGRR